MRLNFTRESHLRRFNRLLSYNLPQEMDMLKYVSALTRARARAHTHTHGLECIIYDWRIVSFQTVLYNRMNRGV